MAIAEETRSELIRQNFRETNRSHLFRIQIGHSHLQSTENNKRQKVDSGNFFVNMFLMTQRP